MKTSVKKGAGSFYDIEIVVDKADQEKARQQTLKSFQKDLALPGFRKGFVPLHLVEEHIQPEYLTVGMYEDLTNAGLKDVLKSHTDIKFIGEPYALNPEVKGDEMIITLKLDIYPTVEVVNEAWKKIGMNTVSADVEDKEVQEAMLRLKKNYADYRDADSIAKDTISKASLKFLDKEGNEVDSTHIYVGEQEFGQEPFFSETFLGKKKGESWEMDRKVLPESIDTKKAADSAKKARVEILDVKQIVLPEISSDTLKKLFGPETTLNNEADLLAYIEATIKEDKFTQGLVQEVEQYLNKVKGEHMQIAIPHTFLDEEMKTRMQHLEQRFGGKEKLDQYFKQMGEEQAKKFLEDIKVAAQESLEKFFILQKISEALELEINWQNPQQLEIEKKLYEKLVGGETKETPKKEVKKTVQKK